MPCAACGLWRGGERRRARVAARWQTQRAPAVLIRRRSDADGAATGDEMLTPSGVPLLGQGKEIFCCCADLLQIVAAAAVNASSSGEIKELDP